MTPSRTWLAVLAHGVRSSSHSCLSSTPSRRYFMPLLSPFHSTVLFLTLHSSHLYLYITNTKVKVLLFPSLPSQMHLSFLPLYRHTHTHTVVLTTTHVPFLLYSPSWYSSSIALHSSLLPTFHTIIQSFQTSLSHYFMMFLFFLLST